MLLVLRPHLIYWGKRTLFPSLPTKLPQVCLPLFISYWPDCTSSLYMQMPSVFSLSCRLPVFYWSMPFSQIQKSSLKRYLNGQLQPPEQRAETRSAWAGPGGKAERGPPSEYTVLTAGTSAGPNLLVLWGKKDWAGEAHAAWAHHPNWCSALRRSCPEGLSWSCQSLSAMQDLPFPVLWGSTLYLPRSSPLLAPHALPWVGVTIRWLNIVRIMLAIAAWMLSHSLVSNSLQPHGL